MPQLDVSIITVNYNGLQDTAEMIGSLEKHLHSCTYELIVVDNGSYRNESAILQERFPFIHAIRSEKNLGFAGGNNLGIQEAQGKYIFLLNNDTFLEEDTLHYLCDTLREHPETAAVSPKIKFATPPRNIQFAGFTPLTKYTLRNQGIGYNEPDCGQYDTPGTTAFLHGAAMMVQREVIKKVGLMPEIFFLYYEEIDWCSQMTRAGYELRYDPRCVVYHKESNTTGTDSPLKTYYLTRNRLLYAWRNRRGITRIVALLYQLSIANPKNLIVNLLLGKTSQLKAIWKGCTSFFKLKNKNS